jgi:hypothetical protein
LSGFFCYGCPKKSQSALLKHQLLIVNLRAAVRQTFA